MISYSLPDYVRHLNLNLTFANLMKTAPELFFDDVSINSIYGCFPDCIMNGGRVISGERYSYDQINDTFDRIEKECLGIRLVPLSTWGSELKAETYGSATAHIFAFEPTA